MFYRISATIFFGSIALWLGYPLGIGIMKGVVTPIITITGMISGWLFYLYVRYVDDGWMFAGLNRPIKIRSYDTGSIIRYGAFGQILLTIGIPLLFGKEAGKTIIMIYWIGLVTMLGCLIIAIWWYKLPRQPRGPRQK